MHGRDVLDIHIWAPSMSEAYREQITDETAVRRLPCSSWTARPTGR